MARALYTATATATVALVGATAKTVIAVITPAQFGLDLLRLEFGFDGVTSSDRAVTVELVSFTTDGTGTAGTLTQVAGRSVTAGFTTKFNYSVEPTTATVYNRWRLTPIGGTAILDLGSNTPDFPVSTVVGLRLTAPTNAVNVDPTMFFARC